MTEIRNLKWKPPAVTGDKVSFKNGGAFLRELRADVEQHLSAGHVRLRGAIRLYAKAPIAVGLIVASWAVLLFDRPDEDIRTDIVDGILLHDYLVDPRQFRVTVESGVVTMEGTPETTAFGHALIRKARHVPGVVAVRDRLSYPDVYPVVAGPVF